MKNLFVLALLASLFAGCSTYSDVKEAFGLGHDYDYSACNGLEEKAKNDNLPVDVREKAFKDLAQCRETAKSLQKEKK